MSTNRKLPPSPLFSSLAILSFKKKGKGEESDLSSIDADGLDLNEGTMSLSDLKSTKGGLGSLGKDAGDGSMALGKSRSDDQKFQDIESSINDMKKELDKESLSGKSMKGDIDNMKKDLTQINDSIKSLLNVYEAVNKQYNPFVDGDEPSRTGNARSSAGQVKSGPIINDPFKGTEPLDRLVKPEEEEEEPLEEPKVAPSEQKMDLSEINLNDDLDKFADVLSPKRESAGECVSSVSEDRTANGGSFIDEYALGLMEKLLIYQIEKVHRCKIRGETVTNNDIDALDRWLNEYKLLGMA